MSFLETRRPGSLARAMGQRLGSLAQQFTPDAWVRESVGG
jgi:hypothetical protein